MTPDTEFRLLLVIAIGVVIGLCKEMRKHDEDARVDSFPEGAHGDPTRGRTR